jgi:membrane fusion protein, heavy metal efflux system
MARKEYLAILGVIAIGLVAVWLVASHSGRPSASLHGDHGHGHGHDHGSGGHDQCEQTGPHGGKILKEGALELELVMHEKGTPPHWRVYCSSNGKTLDPKEVSVTVQIKRLSDAVTVFPLKPEKDFLVSEQEVEEPHSFWIRVEAQWRGEPFEWEYPQYEGRLELTHDLAKTMGITTEVAGPGRIASKLDLPGEIVMNADRVCHVVPRVPGVALSAKKFLGDTVARDEVVAVVDSRELGEARSKYLVALEREKLARYNFERSERLWEKQTVPEKEYLTAQKNYLEEKIELSSARRKLFTMGLTEDDVKRLDEGNLTELTHFVIRSPFDGIVVRKHVSSGEWVKEDAELYIIADLSDVWVEITVYTKDLNSVYVGQKAAVKCDMAGQEASGTVSYVGPVVGEESRTARARVVIPNTDGKWKPGLFVRVELVREEASLPLVVKNDAIQAFKNWSVVFVRYDDEYEARPLVLGRTDGQVTEVLKGLLPGETYVLRNSFILKSELGKAGMSHQH